MGPVRGIIEGRGRGQGCYRPNSHLAQLGGSERIKEDAFSVLEYPPWKIVPGAFQVPCKAVGSLSTVVSQRTSVTFQFY